MTRLRGWVRGDAGAVAVTALVLWLAAAAAGLVVVGTAADVALAAVRAQTAADMAALAAAGATLLGPAPADPRAAAATAARLHGAELLRCCGDVEHIPPVVRVTAAVRPRSALARAARPLVVRHARASLRPAKPGPKSSGFAPILPNS